MLTLKKSRHICHYVSGKGLWETNLFDKPLARWNNVSDPMAWSSIQWHEVRFNGMKFDPMTWSPIQWHEVRSNGMKFDSMAWSPIQWHEKYGPIEWHTIQLHEKYCRIERCLIQWQSIDDPMAWNSIQLHFCLNSPSIPKNLFLISSGQGWL